MDITLISISVAGGGHGGTGPIKEREAILDGERAPYGDSSGVDPYLEAGISSVVLSQLKPLNTK